MNGMMRCWAFRTSKVLPIGKFAAAASWPGWRGLGGDLFGEVPAGPATAMATASTVLDRVLLRMFDPH